MFWDWWQSLFTDMPAYAFFNFKFLPKYGYAVIQGVEYTLILSVVSVLLAVLPALMLATMRLSKCAPVRWLSGAYIAAFRSTPMLVQLIIIYYGVFNAILVPKFLILASSTPRASFRVSWRWPSTARLMSRKFFVPVFWLWTAGRWKPRARLDFRRRRACVW